MKLLEFLETIRENASNEPGTFVGARLTRDSERDITRWMRDNGLRKKEPRARFHITVVGDKERSFDWNPATFEPPLEIDPNSYKIQKFDDGAIVLSFSAPELEKRHEQAIEKYGIQWKYPNYQPHLTLSYDPTELNDINRLLKPTFPIHIQNEYVQPWEFDESDHRSERRRDERLDEALLFERNVMNAPDTNIWAKHMADGMFGPNTAAPFVGAMHGDTNTIAASHAWAQKALRKYMINDVPAPQILAFKPTPNDPRNEPGASPDMSGTAKVHYPRPEGVSLFGILSGHTRDRSMTVPNWVPAALERGEEVFWLDDRFIGQMDGAVAAVRDWFRHLARNEPQRLIPGRLNRMTWEQAEQAAFAWHDQMKAAEDDTDEEIEGDKEIYLDLGGGNAWWKLTGASCLDREGNMMGHCVADYIDEVTDGRSTILSLRDSKNRPHVTMELTNERTWARPGKPSEASVSIEQVKGKENQPPVEKYWKYVDEVIKKLNAEGQKLMVSSEGATDLAETGIEILGSMFIRTSEPMNDAPANLTMVYYPPGREHEWYEHDGEEMQLWEIFQLLANKDILPIDWHEDGLSTPATEWIKWVLLRDGEWTTETKTYMENPDAPADATLSIDPETEPYLDDVPLEISIHMPNIKHEILAGSPEGYHYDIDQAIASRESNT